MGVPAATKGLLVGLVLPRLRWLVLVAGAAAAVSAATAAAAAFAPPVLLLSLSHATDSGP